MICDFDGVSACLVPHLEGGVFSQEEISRWHVLHSLILSVCAVDSIVVASFLHDL
jgi:hypothetical protein